MERKINDVQDLSVRALQFLGAIAFARYCAKIGVRHRAVDELVGHLCALSQTDDFPEWESQLMVLDLHGMGDLPPDDVISELPYDIGGEFHHAVECVVEITMSIAYGAIDDKPQRFLGNLMAIATGRGVALPAIDDFWQPESRRSFGDPIDDETFAEWSAFLP